MSDAEYNPRKHFGDLMQLAHYQALLDVAGVASPDCFAAGVCGTEGVVVWHDLSAPVFDSPEYLDGPSAERISAMTRYDIEFATASGSTERQRLTSSTRSRPCWPNRSSATSATCAAGANGAVSV